MAVYECVCCAQLTVHLGTAPQQLRVLWSAVYINTSSCNHVLGRPMPQFHRTKRVMFASVNTFANPPFKSHI